MNKKLHYINQKIDAIQFALLRYQDEDDREQHTENDRARVTENGFETGFRNGP